MKPIRLMTLAPGHFHAALVQKRMPPGVHHRAHVYAPLDADLLAHLDRLAGFNTRADRPTAWEVDVRAGADYLERFLREQPGNTVVLSGRNRPKIDFMLAAVGNNLNVLADKPWVVDPADFPKLERLLEDAEFRDVLVWDMMTERFEVTNRLQRELVRDPGVFGDWLAGTPLHPALVLESVHHLKKTVAGRPLRRPWWWFDADISGEAIADVGTHLADLALRLVAPDQVVDHTRDVQLLDAVGWPTVLSPEQFGELTGLPDYPPELRSRLAGEMLYYRGNNTVALSIRGVHVRLETTWEYESPGGDTHGSIARGTRATVSIRQEPGGEPRVFVAATHPADRSPLAATLYRKCDALADEFPGTSVQDRGDECEVVIPAVLRTGHEAHFAEVVNEFARYFHAPRSVPPWERTNLLTKYHITTGAVELARRGRAER